MNIYALAMLYRSNKIFQENYNLLFDHHLLCCIPSDQCGETFYLPPRIRKIYSFQFYLFIYLRFTQFTSTYIVLQAGLFAYSFIFYDSKFFLKDGAFALAPSVFE